MSEVGMRAGLSMPSGLRFVQLQRSMLLGDVHVQAGDVVAVQSPAEKPIAIMPVDTRLYQTRAQKLIERKVARPHSGPATVVLGRSMADPRDPVAGDGPVERATHPAQRRAEKATSAPQRGAL